MHKAGLNVSARTVDPASRRIQAEIEIPIRISATHTVDIVLSEIVDDLLRGVIYLARWARFSQTCLSSVKLITVSYLLDREELVDESWSRC